MNARLNPYGLSFFIHLLGLGLLFFLTMRNPGWKKETVEFTVYENPQVAPIGTAVKPLDLSKPPPPKPDDATKPEARSVFGLNKNTLTDGPTASDGESGVEIKRGNTLAVAPDDKKLTDEDAQALPVPTDDYLVTKMAVIDSQFKIPYPEAARKKNVQGPVIMDLLIDEAGLVREANLISGPGEGLNEAALEAVRKFKFKPAYANEKPVAVRVRYTYRFVLE